MPRRNKALDPEELYFVLTAYDWPDGGDLKVNFVRLEDGETPRLYSRSCHPSNLAELPVRHSLTDFNELVAKGAPGVFTIAFWLTTWFPDDVKRWAELQPEDIRDFAVTHFRRANT